MAEKINNCDRCGSEMVLSSSGVWYPVYAIVHKNGNSSCKINSGWYEKKRDAISNWNRPRIKVEKLNSPAKKPEQQTKGTSVLLGSENWEAYESHFPAGFFGR